MNKKENDYQYKNEKTMLYERKDSTILQFNYIDFIIIMKFLIKSKFKKSQKILEIKKLKILGGSAAFASSIAFEPDR